MGEVLALGPNRVTVIARGDATGGRFALVEWLMAPAPAPGPPLHRHHREDEAFLVLDGALEVVVGEGSERLGPGGYAFVPRMTWHTVVNAGDRTCRFLVVLTPPGLEGLWLETAALLAAGSDAPPAAILALQDRYGMQTDGVAREF